MARVPSLLRVASAGWPLPFGGQVVARQGVVAILAGGREWILAPADSRVLADALRSAALEADRLMEPGDGPSAA